MIKKFIIDMTAINVKPKSIIIDGSLHNKFKVLCKGKSMKIGGVIEDLIRVYLNNPKEVQEMINEYKEKHEPKVTV
jgi:hypothetical protein